MPFIKGKNGHPVEIESPNLFGFLENIVSYQTWRPGGLIASAIRKLTANLSLILGVHTYVEP